MALWKQLVYGKLARRVDDNSTEACGEHDWIGKSSGAPPEIVALCDPSRKHVGPESSGSWRDYVWPESHGAITLLAASVSSASVSSASVSSASVSSASVSSASGAAPRVVAGRTRGALESPRPGARHYTQAMFLWADWSDVSLLDLWQLPDLLRPPPLEQPAFDLPCLETTPRDAQLPADWLDATREDLRRLVSGHAVGVQEWQVGPDKFFRRALIVLACLPPAARWRLPVGAGLHAATDDFAYSHAMRARNDARRIGRDWAPTPSPLDLSRGDKYCEWLAKHAGAAGTLAELDAAVRAALPRLAAWNGMEPAAPWRQAMAALDRLERPRAPAPRPLAESLAAIIATLGSSPSPAALESAGSELTRLAESTPSAAWSALSDAAARALGMLAGRLPLAWPDFAPALAWALPDAWIPRARALTRQALNARREADWEAVLVSLAENRAPRWLRDFAADCPVEDLLWRAFHLDAERGRAHCLNGLRDRADVAEILAAVVEKQPLDKAWRGRLAEFVRDTPRHAADAKLALWAWNQGGYLEALCALPRQVGPPPSASSISFDDVADLDEAARGQLADALWRAESEDDASTRDWLIPLWSFVSASDKRRGEARLARDLTPEVAKVLLDAPPPRGAGGPARNWSNQKELLRRAWSVAPVTRDRAQDLLTAGACSHGVRAAFAEWLWRDAPKQPRSPPALWFAQALTRPGACPDWPELSPRDALLAASLINALPRRQVALHPPNAPPSAMGQLLACAAAARERADLPRLKKDALPRALADALNAALLETPGEQHEQHEQAAAFWRERAGPLGLGDQPGWRLFARAVAEPDAAPGANHVFGDVGREAPLDDAREAEEETLALLDDAALALLAARGVRPPDNLLGKLHPRALRRARLGAAELERLLATCLAPPPAPREASPLASESRRLPAVVAREPERRAARNGGAGGMFGRLVSPLGSLLGSYWTGGAEPGPPERCGARHAEPAVAGCSRERIALAHHALEHLVTDLLPASEFNALAQRVDALASTPPRGEPVSRDIAPAEPPAGLDGLHGRLFEVCRDVARTTPSELQRLLDAARRERTTGEPAGRR